PPPPPPFSLVFHDIGWNILHSFTYNYGLNFVGAGLETLVLIATEVDWNWRNVSYNNTWLSNIGRPGLYIGYTVPVITPITTYIIGRAMKDEKLQITSFALMQTLMLTLAIQTPLKMITGRTLPGIVTELDHTRNSRSDNFSDEFNWFNKNFIGGWPSGHTANAFAAAATISEIYNDKFLLKLGLYSYAFLIGFGTTLDVHWASEAIAGVLIGYAIGKSVGKSFSKLLENKRDSERFSFYYSPNTIGIIIKI
ncbi:MAG: phosphatase PAP2 family protein, partial [Treponema sp.]|nr:phosphatase PAP2 family protein [Treponema sp.]